MTDIHITDKESPAQVNYVGWSAPYGPGSKGLSGAYAPTILATTQVLDAAVQTINALHKKAPFDFGIALGDAINNTQYNELRWYIDVLDGKVITPSSGNHAGAGNIDYQKPFKAAGLNKAIPWYQTIGNHDQYMMGSYYETDKTQAAHIGSTILNANEDTAAAATPEAMAGTGFYMGVVDGTTPYGDIIGAGPQANFATPPKVVADPDRHSLVSATSTSLNWMKEFFTTTSSPVGHGFTKNNIKNDFTSYSFLPKPDVPIKVIVLDDTCKGIGQPNYAYGCLDQTRLDWLTNELKNGQDNNQLMIISAHIPINTKNPGIPSLFVKHDTTSVVNDIDTTPGSLLAILHTYPNLMLWVSGHRHVNVVTPLLYNVADPNDHPENSFWEVETASLRDFPQQFRTFDIRRNSDNNISIVITNVDTAVVDGSPAAKSRGYAVASSRIFGADDNKRASTASKSYNAELIKKLTPAMQAIIATKGSAL
jgi:metallophosphoesterase (TIGR03768 family)